MQKLHKGLNDVFGVLCGFLGRLWGWFVVLGLMGVVGVVAQICEVLRILNPLSPHFEPREVAVLLA